MIKKIGLIDDEKNIIEAYSTYIESSIPNCEIITSLNARKILENKELKNIDLFIIDIKLPDMNGIDLACEIIKSNPYSAFLFISGFHDHDFSQADSNKIVYDFVSKPFPLKEFTNRIKILLRASKNSKILNEKLKIESSEVEKLTSSIWDIFNHFSFGVLILNKDMNVLLANYFIAKLLGFENENELIQKNWLEFIPEVDKILVKKDHKEFILKTAKYEYKEYTNNIKKLNGDLVLMKWFNTRLNSGRVGTFSIGVPVKSAGSKDSVDSIRAYWNEIIEKDRTTLSAMKSLVLKNKEC